MLLATDPTLYETIVQFLGLVLAAAMATIITILVVWIRTSLIPWLTSLASKIKVIRQGDMDRAKLEVIDNDAATTNQVGEKWDNPLLLTPKVRRLFAPITADLRRMGAKSLTRNIEDSDMLAFEIERKYREFMLEFICRPLGLSKRGCVVLAEAIATEQDPLGQTGEKEVG